MRKIRIPESFIADLLKVPESGMGYHRVNIELKNGKILKHLIILNGEFLMVEDNENVKSDEIERIFLDN